MTLPSHELYREIPLTQGQVAIVDADNYEWLSQFKWSARWAKNTRSYYAIRNSWKGEYGRRKTVSCTEKS